MAGLAVRESAIGYEAKSTFYQSPGNVGHQIRRAIKKSGGYPSLRIESRSEKR